MPKGDDRAVQLEERDLRRHRARLAGSTCPRSTTARTRRPASWSFRTAAATMSPKGQFRVPIVFDNLIHKKEMPVMIGIFINPGTFPTRRQGGQEGQASNRSFEYDTLSRPVRPLPGEGDPARGRQEVQPAPGRRRPRHRRHQRRAASAPSPSPGSGPTCSARCSATSAASPTSAAATAIPASSARRRTSRSASSCRTARTTSTTTHGNWSLGNQQMDVGAQVQEVRLQVRLRRRRPQRQARRRHPARIAALAVARRGLKAISRC